MSTSRTKQTLHSALVATIVCSVFIGATYLHAEWANPPSNPPDGNVAAPINTSGSDQFKDGGAIGADRIIGFDMIRSHQNIRAENLLITENQVRSDTYCDRSGNNCFSPADVGGTGDQYDSCDGYPHGTTQAVTCGPTTGQCDYFCKSCNTATQGTRQCNDGEWVTVTEPTCLCISGD